MNRNTYLALLAAVSIPFAAVAQEQTQDAPAQTEEPLIESDSTTGDQAAEETAPADDTQQAAEEAAPADDTEQMAEEEMAPADGAEQAAEDTMTEDDGAELAGADAVEGPFVTVPQTGAWRVTNLEGKNVEDANGESIGDINDVLVNERGEVIAVLVGVGGFLGIGQKDVAVSMSALEFGPGKTEGLKTEEQRRQELDAEAQSAAQAPATDATGVTGATGTTNTQASIEPPVVEEPVVGDDNLPDRIVLNVTREQLEAAPAYDDIEAGIDATATSDVPADQPAEQPLEPAD